VSERALPLLFRYRREPGPPTLNYPRPGNAGYGLGSMMMVMVVKMVRISEPAAWYCV